MAKSTSAPARSGQLARLAADAAGCTACDLYRNATQTVFGRGAASARVLLVGEQPGDQEDKAGEPFVGPAGRRIHEKPSAREVAACHHWLDAELAAVDPAVLVALGATAGQALFGSRFRVGTARGQPLDLDGRAVVATIHPSAVLRVPKPADRDEQYAGLVADLRRAADLEKETR